MSDEKALGRFAGAYGRMCLIGAQAHATGLSMDLIGEAMRGQGTDTQPVVLSVIRAQRLTMQARMREALEAGVLMPEILQAARNAKWAVEGEWNVKIPVASKAVE